MSESEDEYVLLESYSPEYDKIIVLDNDEHSIWAFVMDGDSQEIEYDAFVISLTEPFQTENEVQELIDQGYAPPILAEYASDTCVDTHALKKDFSVRWMDDGWVEILINGKQQVLIDLDEEAVFTKAVKANGPYGLVFTDDLISDDETED